ncbi:MAG: RagB/SusD family nutrient uptake outer membrane protein [Chitinophagaceae bacterium]|nr:RagB/SusD family nutrient uptake outer membrane protein [Chitinophagaceae bacterium]
MKNKIYQSIASGIIAFILFAGNGCRKFTEVEPISEYSVPQTFSSVTNAYAALLGAYKELQGDAGYGIRISLYWPYDTDEGVVTGNIDNDRRGIGRYQMLTSNLQITNPFNQLYKGIEKANLCIEQIPQMAQYTNGTASEQSELKRMHGEALTLRAQYYLELIRNFGDVPATFQPAYHLKDLFIPQANRDSTYDKLLEDLALASTLLPWRTEAGSYNERITKGAAKALRARVALHRGGYSLRQNGQVERGSNHLAYYQIAKKECEELMARRDQHTLHANFQEFWVQHSDVSSSKNPSGEILFEIGAGGGNGTTDSRLGDYDGPVVNVNTRYSRGSGAIKILPTYFYAFDSVDTRRDVTITYYSIPAPGTDGVNYKRATTAVMTTGKYRIDWRSPTLGSPGSNPINKGLQWVLIRFSDVLLMYAEAANEINSGPTPEAITAFEEVRKRGFRGNTGLIGITPTDKAGFFNAIVNERFLEFGNEAIRKYDLLRWNLLETKINEARANLVKLRDRVAPYNNVPQYIYYKNGGTVPFSVNTLNGEGLIYYTTAAPTGGNLPFWKPAQVPPSGVGSAPSAGQVTSWVRVNWAQQLTSNYADGFPLSQAMARFFVHGKSELMPYTDPILISYQGKLTQNPGY